MEPIRIAYQSYTSEEQAGSYWKHLREHLYKIVDEGTISREFFRPTLTPIHCPNLDVLEK